jgi:hypothetical protein
MQMMRGKNSPHLLREYEHVPMDTLLEYYEGRLITGSAAKEIFHVENRTRRGFPDFETFLKMKCELHQVRQVSDAVMAALPVGPPLPTLMDK